MLKYGFLLIAALSWSSCNFKEKSEELKVREQKLLEKEKAFAMKESDYQNLLKMRDSLYAAKDTIQAIPLPDNILGKWSGKMICVDSNCPENMIGDIRNDNWEFSENGQKISAKVTNKAGNIRIYTGSFNGSEIRLSYQSDSTAAKKSYVNIILNDLKDTKIRGTRDVIGDNNCTSRFSIDLDKSKN
ncbi:hypothetical protein [Chryseobacterium koreense]|uniref:Uncharacterized protein n=1 Tax=Chryseobacterium koreense CCUG 49689 TaxID=1304281 RepID=A0A0J7J214_9FLAO|nr:hypothetical protein [Chryseobacterium koreense]KMQ72317.1 hypothetical protein ACM44_02410 [Chryseobacterium koreense CCUG 49689]MBB5333992.1 hypothetical protein [Chryseobacterium koreense]